MKQLFILIIAACLILPVHSGAQNRMLKKVIELKMPKTVEDNLCGTRGGSVCWNPVTKKYYAAFAGNTGFPMAVFDLKGKRLSDDDLITMKDIRGLWYDPVTKKICGNGYNETGWFSYTLDKNGIPIEITVDHEGLNQPDENSAGIYNPLKKEVIFLNKDEVTFYKTDATSNNTLTLPLAIKKSEDNGSDQNSNKTSDEYNNTSVIYTGIIGSELGVLNTTKKQIEFFSYSKGEKGKILNLPDDAPVESSFNFACCNGIYWVFDIKERTWLGFR